MRKIKNKIIKLIYKLRDWCRLRVDTALLLGIFILLLLEKLNG